MKLQDFIYDESLGVHIHPKDGARAGYLDGAEGYLAQELKNCGDLGIHSQALKNIIKDWPSQYHLSPYRCTILDCFDIACPDAKVLELGAGCGAISRWLGENFGNVVSVEGNLQRATVAKLRCQDLTNLSFYYANFHDLEYAESFDIATLIGVLEYSHMYHPEYRGDPESAALSTLQMVYQNLGNPGILILAIENKYGLKYFSGAREDHSGRMFDSIQGYPNRDSAITYSASSLEDMILNAGFSDLDFFLPFPDYKLATDIINVNEISDNYFLHNWVNTPFPDRSATNRMVFFNESLAVRELIKDGMIRDFSNSFLIVAYKDKKEKALDRLGIKNQSWIAKHYTLDRHPFFCKKATLINRSSGEVLVKHEPAINNLQVDKISEGKYIHKFSTETHIKGDQVIFQVFKILATKDFKSNFIGLLSNLNRFLLDDFSNGYTDEENYPLLEGESHDVMFWNIIEDGSRKWHFIDREWIFKGELPVDYVIWRNLIHLFHRYKGYIPKQLLENKSIQVFITEYIKNMYPTFNASRYSKFEQLEQDFHRWVNASRSQK